MEKEILIQKKQLEQDKEQHLVLLKSWQSQCDQLNRQHQTDQTDLDKTKSELDEKKNQLSILQEKFNEMEAKLHANEILVQMSRNSKSSTAITHLTNMEDENKDLRMKVSLAEKEIVSLRIQLEDSRDHAKQYKQISDTVEKTLRESSESNANMIQTLENKINTLIAEKAKQEVTIKEMTLKQTQLEKHLEETIADTTERIEQFTNEKAQLIIERDLTKQKLETNELILEERTRLRDQYMAQISILEEKNKLNEDKINEMTLTLQQHQTQFDDLKNQLELKNEELNRSQTIKAGIKTTNATSELIFNETNATLATENERLTAQINLLQEELARMGQDLIALQKQDIFKGDSDSSSRMETETSEPSTREISTSTNLLEINRFIRTQKEQLAQQFDELKLNYEITQQRMKTLQNDYDFIKKQNQQYEIDITRLNSTNESLQRIANTTKDTDSDEYNRNNNIALMRDTNKRLKEECVAQSEEAKRLANDLQKQEEEIISLKSNLNASQIEKESVIGQNSCLLNEIKRWKERVDSLMVNSDNADEWQKIQKEIQDSEEKNQQLTDIVNELRKNQSDLNVKYETTLKDLEAIKATQQAEKAKAQQDLDALRSEKNKKEETFKALVSDLRDVVTSVQKELQLKPMDWQSVGKGSNLSERIRLIKEELSQMKKQIIAKLKENNNELCTGIKKIQDSSSQLTTIQKKLEEAEGQVKEKETKIGQMNNFIAQTKTRLQTQTKINETLKKELEDSKKQNTTTTNIQTTTTTSNTENFIAKSEHESLKSKFIQSQLELDKLKKKLTATTTATTPPITIEKPKSPTNKPKTIISTSAQKVDSSDNSTAQQQPPTAYIAPSRIGKATPPPSQSVQPSSTVISLKQTAAVQPTPHDSGVAINQQRISTNRQQLVTPMTSNNNSIDLPTTSTNSGATSSSFVNKRTREEDSDESSMIEPLPNNSNTNNNKKQRQQQQIAETENETNNNQDSNELPSQIHSQQQQSQTSSLQIATIEPFSSTGNNEGSNSVNNEEDYIHVQNNNQQQHQQQQQQQDIEEVIDQEEIVLGDDTDIDEDAYEEEEEEEENEEEEEDDVNDEEEDEEENEEEEEDEGDGNDEEDEMIDDEEDDNQNEQLEDENEERNENEEGESNTMDDNNQQELNDEDHQLNEEGEVEEEGQIEEDDQLEEGEEVVENIEIIREEIIADDDSQDFKDIVISQEHINSDNRSETIATTSQDSNSNQKQNLEPNQMTSNQEQQETNKSTAETNQPKEALTTLKQNRKLYF
jgi:hypothetical protein